MDPFLIAQGLKAIEQLAMQALGPLPALGLSISRMLAGINDTAYVRRAHFLLQRDSVADRNKATYQNTLISPGEAIRLFNQLPAQSGVGSVPGAAQSDYWAWLAWYLSAGGIDLDTIGDGTAPGTAQDWRQLVMMSASAAPLADALRAWNRTRHNADAAATDAENELAFHLRRAGYSRPQDRDLLAFPFAPWTTDAAQQLAWLGVIPETDRIAMFRAAGYSRNTDEQGALWMAARLPSPATLVQWGLRRLWDQSIADRYGLDERFQASPEAVYWSRRQGEGILPGDLPGEPASERDFLKLQFREQTPLPAFGQAVEMQHRLRSGRETEGESVIAGTPDWTAEDTENMLRVEGFSQPIIDRLMGLTIEPLNVRILNTTLHEALTHPEVAADVQAAFGAGVDWVKEVYLDHGFADHIAQMAADAARAKADDSYYAERTENIKRQRTEKRDQARREYLAGILDDVSAGQKMTDEFFTGAMAQEEIEYLNKEFHLSLVQTQVKEIGRAYAEGKVSIEQADVQLQAAGIVGPRRVLYIQEWVWERNESRRVLSTGETLSMLKTGMIDSGSALVRLVNLGWSQPDALLELSAAQAEIARAQAKALTLAESKLSSLAERKARLAAQDAKVKAEADAKAKAAKAKADRLVQLAPFEQEALKAKYQGEAFLDQAAYAAAEKKGNKPKMDAEIAKASAAYADWLIGQIKLRQQGQEIGHEIEPIDTERVPVPPASQGDSGSTGATPSSPNPVAGENGGAGPAGNP